MENQRKILIIDTDPFERISCRAMLRGPEFIVPFCEDRESALKRASKEEFDLIISNLFLPNKHTGLTLVQELHFIQPKTDIVVMSDRPSIWDAREVVRLGASGYLERPFNTECLMNVARKTFDRKGWIVRKANIDLFRDYVVPSPERDDPTIYYKNGSWARHLERDLWEVGYDMKYWSLSGRGRNGAGAYLDGDLRRADNGPGSRSTCEHTLSVRISEGLSALVAGEAYGHVSSGSGRSYALTAPMTGTVREVNGEADDIMTSCVPGDSGLDWMLWLARVQAKEWEYGTLKDIEEGRQVGLYEHVRV